MFGAPLVFNVLQILGLLLFVRHNFDNLEKFYRDRHNNPNAYRDMVNKLYKAEDNSQDTIDAFMEQKFEKKSKENRGDADEEVTYSMAFSRKYIKSTMVAIVMNMSFMLTALNLVGMYTFPFFTDIGIDPNFGSILYGAAGFIAACFSPFLFGLVTCLTVKRGLSLSFALLTAVFVTLTLSIHFDSNAGSLTSIIIYAFVV